MHLNIFNKHSPELRAVLARYVPGFDVESLAEARLSPVTRRKISLAIARCILFDEYQFTIEEVMATNILRLETGEPYLKVPGENDLNISISHSGDWFACVISSQHEKTCIDIEDKSLNRKWQSIAKRYFSAIENQYVLKTGINGFYKLWTTKEALAKLAGKGLEKVLQTKMDQTFIEAESVYENEGVKIQHAQTDDYYYTIATKKINLPSL